MTSHKSDIHTFRCKLNNNNQSIIIAFNIKDVMLPANVIDTIECSFYICKAVPCSP